ncbi:MAG: type IV pilin protein [Pseudomonadota bacterium]|nr:type IV pilin protein [Pseudomonadota bacterium]
MTLDAQSLERCYSQNFDYVTNCNMAAGTLASPQGYYNVTITIVNAVAATNTPASYNITAAPIAPPQLSDSACMTFSLNSAGAQLAWNGSGVVNTQTCWGST